MILHARRASLWKSTDDSGPGSPFVPKVRKEWEMIRAQSQPAFG